MGSHQLFDQMVEAASFQPVMTICLLVFGIVGRFAHVGPFLYILASVINVYVCSSVSFPLLCVSLSLFLSLIADTLYSCCCFGYGLVIILRAVNLLK